MPASRLPSRLGSCLLAIVLALAAPGGASAASPPARPTALDARVSLAVDGMAVHEALQLVAKKGRINMILQDDLRDVVTADFSNVRLGDALDTLLDMAGAQGYWRGNILYVIGRRRAAERGLVMGNARLFGLRFASAEQLAAFLTTRQSGLGVVKADPRSNTLLVSGTPAEIALAERAVEALDRPTPDRVFKLSHAHAVDVAALLNATLFASGAKVEGQPLRAEIEATTEGQGASQTGSGTQIGQGGMSIRSRTATTQSITVDARAPIAVPDSRTNAVIVLAPTDVLEAAAAMIARLDRPVAQVSITVEVIEVNSQDALELGTSFSGASGATTTTLDPGSTTSPAWSIAYDPASALPTAFRARLNALVRDRKARLVAHPTIVAADNTEAQINIVDEVIKGTKISNQGFSVNGQNLIVVEPIFGSAGVMLNILPRIGADGRVTLRLHPTVSSIRETQKDSMNNLITLLSRRELVAQQVIVRSGTSLALAGLTQTNRIDQGTKLPFIGSIPLLGALFGQNTWTNQATELMILVTPRILDEAAPPPQPRERRP